MLGSVRGFGCSKRRASAAVAKLARKCTGGAYLLVFPNTRQTRLKMARYLLRPSEFRAWQRSETEFRYYLYNKL